MKSFKHRLGLFYYFLITYLCVFLIPFICLTSINTIFVQQFEKNINKHNMSIINTSIENVDIILNEIKNTSFIIQSDNNISDFLKIDSFDGPNKDILSLRYIMSNLNNIKNVNNDIVDIFIYSPNSDIVITTLDFFKDSRFFVSDRFFNIKDVDYDKIRNNIFMSTNSNTVIPYENIKIKNNVYNGYFYCVPIPKNSNNYRSGTAIFCLKDTIFSRTLKGLNLGDMGLVRVTDNNVNLYYQKGNIEGDFPSFYDKSKYEDAVEFVDDGTQFVSIWKKSEKSGLIYTAYIPKDLIMQQANTIKQITLFVCLCSVIVAVVLAVFLSENNSKPIREILTLFSSKPSKKSYKSILYHLKGNIDSVLTSNNEIETRLEEQIPIVKSATIHNLLNGNYNNDDEILHLIELSSINLKADWHSVLIMRLSSPHYDTYEDIVYENKIIMLITDIVKSLGSQYFVSVYSYNVDRAKIAFLLSFNLEKNNNLKITREPKKIQNYIEYFAKLIYDKIFEKTGIKIVSAIGEAYIDIKNISTSFDQAKQTLLSIPNFSEKSYFYFNDITHLDCDFYYPFEMEQRIGNAIKFGNKSRVEQLLKVVYLENFVKKQLSTKMKIHLLNTLYTTLIRCVGEIDFTVNPKVFLINYNRADVDFDIVFDLIIEEFLNVCNFYSTKKNNDNDSYKQQIVEFINSNFSDCNLNLAIIAQKFGVAERTLYYFFKNSLNETFTSYLENIRIEKAKNYLTSSNLSVEKVSYSVGYSNLRSFQRAFKRVVGCSPNNYRMNNVNIN